MKPSVQSAVGCVVLLLCACPRSDQGPGKSAQQHTAEAIRSEPVAAHQDESEAHQPTPSKVRLSDEVVKAAGIATEPASLKALPTTVNLTGEIAADPDRAAQVTLRVPGRIVDVRFKEGARVKAGSVLAIIESTDLASARAALSSARAMAEASRINVERLERVAEKGLASGQEVANARAGARSTAATEAAARQSLLSYGGDAAQDLGDGSRLAVRAPIDGVILRRDAVRGQTVTAEHVLAEIADLDRAYFLGRLFEKDLALVRQDATAEVRACGRERWACAR